jgi:hypothetical protein
MLNSNKRAITLNLEHQRGRALLFEMARRRCVAREFLTRHHGPARRRLDDAVSGQPAPRLCLRIGLWPKRVGSRPSGDVSDYPSRFGPDQHNRLCRWSTGQGWTAIVDFLSGIHLYAAVTTALFERGAREGAGGSKSRCKKPLTPPSPRILMPIGSQAAFHREPATAAIRARRSTNDGYVAINVAVEDIGITCWPRSAVGTCATTRVSRRMPIGLCLRPRLLGSVIALCRPPFVCGSSLYLIDMVRISIGASGDP